VHRDRMVCSWREPTMGGRDDGLRTPCGIVGLWRGIGVRGGKSRQHNRTMAR
jgi:hypothetical protein